MSLGNTKQDCNILEVIERPVFFPNVGHKYVYFCQRFFKDSKNMYFSKSAKTHLIQLLFTVGFISASKHKIIKSYLTWKKINLRIFVLYFNPYVHVL